MKIMPMGDYYAWYCEWCDSKNLTLWQKFEIGTVTCGACHKNFSTPGVSGSEECFAISGGF